MTPRTEIPTPQELTLALGGRWDKTRGGGKAKCPAHDDANPSLEITQRGDRTVFKCRAGCAQQAVLGALRAGGHWPEAKRGNGHANGISGGDDNIVAKYSYQLENGAEHFQIVRRHPKKFQVRRSDGKGGWKYQRPIMHWHLPYHLPELIEAIASGHTVFVVEGEKDVDNLAKLNVVATCNAGGAGKWTAKHAVRLKGADVVIIPDNDDAGRNHAQQIAKSLDGIAKRVRTLELPGLAMKGDTSDWIAAGHTAEELWALVETTATEAKTAKAGASPTASTANDPAHWNVTPWPEPVSGAAILDDICGVLTRYMVLPKHAAEAIALWVLHAWAFDAWDISPLLIIVSPTKQCGKSTLLTVIYWITPHSSLISNATASPIFRLIEDAKPAVPTFLLDEGDSYLKPDKEDLRGILNSGHMRAGARVIRTDRVGGEHKAGRFSTWAPKAIGTIKAVADTLMDRGIIVRLRRKRKEERVERFRMRDTDEFAKMRQQARRWADDNVAGLREADPAVPDALHNRPADNWRALLAVANAAGGDWPDRAREAALGHSGSSSDDDGGVMLLGDTRKVFEEDASNPEWLGAETLVARLIELPETPWKEWRRGEKEITSRGVAKMLAEFGIKSDISHRPRRYWRRDFKTAWAAYLPHGGDSSG
jgi:5S rRNA maturation endonuclease (ribonuclease M5)